jgi:hypothetical protein
MNKVVKIKKQKRTIESVVEQSSIDFNKAEQGIDLLAYSIALRALGLANKDTRPKKLSNYIRSGYLQVQLISSVILFQLRGDEGVSRDDLYDSICEVLPLTSYANYRKVLRIGVDNEIFTRTRSKIDSRRTMYHLSSEMVEPLCNYFGRIMNDFGKVYSEAVDNNLSQEEILKLIYRLGAKTGLDNDFKGKGLQK